MAGATYVPDVDVVHVVECVRHVHGLPKFVQGFLPTKTNDYREGRRVHIPGGVPGIYQAIYIPDSAAELKTIVIAFSAFNLADTYDIIVGGTSTAETEEGLGNMPARVLGKNIPVTEMVAVEQFELYNEVPRGTPIIVQFYNNSMTEKVMFVEFITLQDRAATTNLDTYKWNHEWNGYHINTFGTQEYKEQIRVPHIYNMYPTRIVYVEIIAKELIVTGRRIATITFDKATGMLDTTYIEDINGYYGMLELNNPGFKIYARSGPIMITNVEIIPDSVGDILEITFKREDQSSSLWESTGRINMTLSITVTSKII